MAAAGVWTDITTAENVLRDLVEELLREEYGNEWLGRSGLTEGRIQKLHDALAEEKKRRDGGKVNERLIYYAHLWDLKKILGKNWDLFADCFGNKKTMDLNLDRLASFRNPEAHGRDLLPFEEHLALGITGEIRNKVTIFMSQRSGEPEHFPRIESAVDSFGNTAESIGRSGHEAPTDLVLHPGDRVSFNLRAWDPDGLPWTWNVYVATGGGSKAGITVTGDSVVWDVLEEHIADPATLQFLLRGGRPYHRHGGSGSTGYDDSAQFTYRVLPR